MRTVFSLPFSTLVFALMLLATPARGELDADTGPADPAGRIEAFHEILLGVMKDAKAIGVRERYRRLEPAVKEIFALPLMVRIASGTYWSKGSDADRARLLGAFERMSIATYADRFDGYSGESFETVGTKPGPQGTTLVETRIIRPKDDPVDIVYVFREIQGEWRVVDVLLDSGISELARYRSEYAKILRDRGVDGLVEELEAKVTKVLGTDFAEKR